MKSPSHGDGSHPGVFRGFEVHGGISDDDAVARWALDDA